MFSIRWRCSKAEGVFYKVTMNETYVSQTKTTHMNFFSADYVSKLVTPLVTRSVMRVVS